MSFIGDYQTAISTYNSVVAEVESEVQTFNEEKSAQFFLKQSLENLHSMLSNEQKQI